MGQNNTIGKIELNPLSQGISSFCSAGGQGSELNNNLFPPCKVLLMTSCKH